MDKLEKQLAKAIHDKIGCCEETLIIITNKKEDDHFLVQYYIPSLDRHEQTKSIKIKYSDILTT